MVLGSWSYINMFLFNEEKLHSAVAVVTGYIAVLFFNLRLNTALIHYLNVLLMGMKFSDFTNFVFTVPVNKSDNKRYKNIGGVGGGGGFLLLWNYLPGCYFSAILVLK